MEENKDYQVYRFDYLTEGSQLKLEHNVYCDRFQNAARERTGRRQAAGKAE